MAIKRLLIANRGEIAVRIIRAAKELGIATLQVHSAADAESLAVKMADEAINIGPPMASKSYLNIASILKAAADTGADAVHPGYGFLAENADFADAVEAAGLIWVGPKGDAIRVMGDKVAARVAAESAGVPVVPGSDGRIDDPVQARSIALAIGFPVMIKAAAGGGGRGIRIAHDMEEFDRLLPQASAEAKAAFGDGGLYVERSSNVPATSKCRFWAMAPTSSTFLNANAPCSAVARKCGKRRPRPPCRRPCAKNCVLRQSPWPKPSTIVVPARWNICMMTRPAFSTSSR
jgi:acetyl/propionyl-CoA carboxylase alpha subunit